MRDAVIAREGAKRLLRTLILPFVAVLVALGVMQTLIGAELINAYWSRIMQLACIMTISALGLNIIYGYTGQFSLGHAAFYGIGAYVSALFTKGLGFDNPFLFPLALAAGSIAAGTVAFLVGLPILRLRSDYLGIATLGFGIIVKVMFDNADAIIPLMGGSRGMTGIPSMTTFVWAFLLVVVAILIMRNFVYSSPGRACLSIREDEIAADTMGIDTTRYKTVAFVMGCAYAGLAGGLFAHLYVFLHPSMFDFLKSIDVLLIVILGGLGSISGTIIAAVGWTFLLEGLRVILPQEILDWRMVIYPVLLIVMMILRPRGLMGGTEIGFLRQPRVPKLVGRREDAARAKEASAGN